MNTTIRTLMNLEAAGTSEGAKKGWESREPSGYGENTEGREMQENWETRTHNTPAEIGERAGRSDYRKQKDSDEGPAGPPFFGTKPNIKAWGTSQGVKKEWETRHGGQMKQMNKSRGGDTGYWSHHRTEGENRPYHIYQGSGPRGGQWMAKEAHSSKPEVKIFNSYQEAKEHVNNSQE